MAALVFPWLLRPSPATSIIGSGQRQQMANALRPVPESMHHLLPLLTDTHCHICGYGEEARAQFAEETASRNNKEQDINAGDSDIVPASRVREMNAAQYIVVSVDPSDWSYCDADNCPRPPPHPPQASAAGSRSVRPAFGIHPQCAEIIDDPNHSNDDDTQLSWLCNLRTHLITSPWAVVGECGLDNNKPYKQSFLSHQIPIFLHHLRLAAELHRPLSVHSVKADGVLVDMLQAEVEEGRKLPPTICLHSFSGSLETLSRIVNVVEGRPRNKRERMMRPPGGGKTNGGRCNCDQNGNVRLFVGFNAWTNLYKVKASQLVRGLVADTPHGEMRLLIESDWNPSDFDFVGSDKRDADKILMNSLVDLCGMLEWEPHRAAQTLAKNTMRFLQPVLESS